MKKPLLYPKLAWQGIRKNAETYLPYLLMGILMVGVSYKQGTGRKAGKAV